MQRVRQAVPGEGGNVKRRLLIAAVFLLAGAVVNVAVAWGCAVWVDVGSPDWEYGSRYVSRWRHAEEADTASVFAGEQLSVRRWKRAGATLISVERDRRDLGSRGGRTPEQLYPTWVDFKVSDQYTSGLTNFYHRWLDGRGWPRLSMWYELEVRDGTHLQVTGIRGGIQVSLPQRIYRVHPLLHGTALPLLPIWPGFAVNTIFYATTLWLLACGLLAMRRLVRLKRGLCPACGYPMGKSSVCSECGKALPLRKAAT